MIRDFINKIFTFLRIRVVKSVDDILDSLNAQIDELQSLANTKMDEALEKWAKSDVLRVQSVALDREGEVAQEEAIRSSDVATKLKEFTKQV